MGENAALMRFQPGVPATQKSVSFRGMSWVEIQNGQIVRGWDSWNLGALLQSLGAGPADVRL